MSEIAQDASRRKGMMSVSESGGGGGGGGGGGIRTSSSELGSEFASNPVITAGEAERLVESLEPFPLEEVGSEKWLKQHEVLDLRGVSDQYGVRDAACPLSTMGGCV